MDLTLNDKVELALLNKFSRSLATTNGEFELSNPEKTKLALNCEESEY